MPPRAIWNFPEQHVGRQVLLYATLDSTSTLAMELAQEPNADGLAILADEQTAGRGQHGRSWNCPGKMGILLSVILFPPQEIRRAALLTAWAAVSVCDTVRALTTTEARIKWPNDIHMRGKKICGILIEQRHATIAGIGLNVNQTLENFQTAGLPEATSLAIASGQTHNLEDVARVLLAHLDRRYRELLSGNLSSLEHAWRDHLGLLGQPVALETADGITRGTLRQLTFDGLTLDTAQGPVFVTPERVRHVVAMNIGKK